MNIEKLNKVKDEMNWLHTDILAISEFKWAEIGHFQWEDTGHKKVKKLYSLHRKTIAKIGLGYNAISDWVIVIRVCRQLFHIILIQVYVPVADTEGSTSLMVKFKLK